MKTYIFTAFFLLTVTVAQAQSRSAQSSSYTTALGLKVWDGAGITLKHFFNDRHAGEAIAFFWHEGFRLTGLYEIHFPISGAPGLQWYIGPGLHVGAYNDNHYYYYHGEYYHDSHASLGIDGVIGLDYKINSAPINLSLDWQPSFEFAQGHGFIGSWGGLGIRYTF